MGSFINVYNPPEEGLHLIKKVVDIIVSESQRIIVTAGDLSLVMDHNMDT